MAERPVPVKCVVWDLDRTVWEGVCGQDHPLRLRPGVAQLFETLDRRGVLQSVASRSDPELAAEALRDLDLERYLLFPQITDEPKSRSLERIAASLRLGPESILLVDDDAFERDEVRSQWPQVRTWPAERCLELARTPELAAGPLTPEAAGRRRTIQALQRSERDQQRLGDRQTFLAQCQMVLTLRPATAADGPRVRELLLRTHRTSNAGGALGGEALELLLARPDRRVLVARFRDRYDDFGTVGVAVIGEDGSEAVLDAFCVSCRLEGRSVGAGFLAALLGQLQQEHTGLCSVRCRCLLSRANRPMVILLKLAGFGTAERHEDEALYRLQLPAQVNPVPYIRLELE